MRSISVTCVVLGSMANLDAERGRMSPKISSPFRRNISEMCSSSLGIGEEQLIAVRIVDLERVIPPPSVLARNGALD